MSATDHRSNAELLAAWDRRQADEGDDDLDERGALAIEFAERIRRQEAGVWKDIAMKLLTAHAQLKHIQEWWPDLDPGRKEIIRRTMEYLENGDPQIVAVMKTPINLSGLSALAAAAEKAYGAGLFMRTTEHGTLEFIQPEP